MPLLPHGTVISANIGEARFMLASRDGRRLPK